MTKFKWVFLSLSFFSITMPSFSQVPPVPQYQMRWQHLDPERDNVYGISMDRAYKELLKDRPRKKVIVAIIDSGTDTTHEDLKQILWCNPADLGGDEDHNGYKNDHYGWNFLGERKGKLPIKPGFEYQRIYLSHKNARNPYSNINNLKPNAKGYNLWLDIRTQFKFDSANVISSNVAFWKNVALEDSLLRKALNREVYVWKDIQEASRRSGSPNNYKIMSGLLKSDSLWTNEQQLNSIGEAKVKLLRQFTLDPIQYRQETIGDDYLNFDDRFYGNSFVNSMDNHGTHVSGIIGAIRNNGKGIDGIADAVQLMTIKVVPKNADEYDKDVALAIRYAVDNGAKVVNMSFGKAYSPQRKWVEDAIKYAAKNDVLLVLAAGNEAANSDSIAHFPSPKYIKGGIAPNTITVGASGVTNKNIVAAFSNYGKHTVDVFAPGVAIYSTINGNEYTFLSGTSMASPVVAGLATVLRSYYPKLSAVQVKEIIESSVRKIDFPVITPGKKERMVNMSDLCKTGGIVNAFNAIKFADVITGKKIKRN